MKKQIIATAVALTLGSVSMTANAEAASASLNWFGVVNTIFNSADISLTGQGGSENIYPAVLQIDKSDGTFKTALNGVTVEAYVSNDVNGDGSLYEPDLTQPFPDAINWTIATPNVYSTGDGEYDAAALQFTINDVDAVIGDVVANVDTNVISVKVAADTSAVLTAPTVGAVQVTAVVYAEKANLIP